HARLDDRNGEAVNGVHDMGGMHGFGPIQREAEEPVFHYRWEARTFALRQACGALGRWNIDMARHANERMPPEEYLPASYYELWGAQAAPKDSVCLDLWEDYLEMT